MSDVERQAIFASRQLRGGSWRRPPLWNGGKARYMITASCYEHAPIIGATKERILEFEACLLAEMDLHSTGTFAHVILPNHYHVLVETADVGKLRTALGKLHGRSSFSWNKEDNAQGRKVFHGSAETIMKSERHFHASLNYIHQNPVKHGYVNKWQDWPYSSARTYLAAVGQDEAKAHWLEYPIDTYGQEWDR